MIRFNPLNPRTQCQMVRGFNGLKRIIADQSREAKILSEYLLTNRLSFLKQFSDPIVIGLVNLQI